MSKRKRRGPTARGPAPRPQDHSSGAVWVLSDMAPDGAYIVTVQYAADRVFSPKDPVAYALAVITACGYARYDAAVLAQMTTVTKGKLDIAGKVVADLREDRPPVDDAATAPLVFTPIVAVRDRSPQLLVTDVNGAEVTQWTPGEAAGHALHVLDAYVTVDTDAAYYRYLTGVLETPAGTARAAVEGLGDFR